MAEPVPCPFLYANGKRCKGTVVRVEQYRVTVGWSYDEDGAWTLDWGEDGRGTHFHLFCNAVSEHNPPVKLWPREMPAALRTAILESGDPGGR
jgi:hypothetical protein